MAKPSDPLEDIRNILNEPAQEDLSDVLAIINEPQKEDDLSDVRSILQQDPDELADVRRILNQPIDVETEEGPGVVRTVAGIGAEAAIGTVGQVGGAALGAAIGTAFIPGIGTVTGAAIGAAAGYLIGALGSGAIGSAVAQSIEGRKSIDYGRMTADALINALPTAKIGKAGKGVKEIAKQFGKAAAIRGAEGAAIGAGAEIVQTAINEQRLPNFEELGDASVLGAALGGALGIGETQAKRIISKFSGKDIDSFVKAAEEGDIDANTLINSVSNLAPEVNNTAKKRILNYVGSYRTVAGPGISGEAEKAKGRVSRAESFGIRLEKEVNKIVKDSEAPDEVEDIIYRYIESPEQTELPQNLRKHAPMLYDFVEETRSIRQELIDNHHSGKRILPDALLNKIEASATDGDYLRQSYKVWEDPKWVNDKNKFDAAVKSLMRPTEEGRGLTRQEAQDYLNGIIEVRKNRESDINRVFAQHSSILKKRHTEDIPPEVREWMGERTDIGSRLRATISSMTKLAAYDTADANIAQDLIDKGLTRTAADFPSGIEEGWVPLRLRRGAGVFDENGNFKTTPVSQGRQTIAEMAEGLPDEVTVPRQETIFIPKETQDAINGLYASQKVDADAESLGSWAKETYFTLAGASKLALVPLSPAAYMPQIHSGFAMLSTGGMTLNPAKFKTLLKESKDSAVAGVASQYDSGYIKLLGKSPSLAADVKDFQKRGLSEASVITQDLVETLKSGKFAQAAVDKLDPLAKAYQVPDAAFRFMGWKKWQDNLRSLFPNAGNEESIKDGAAYVIKQLFPYYPAAAKAVRNASKVGVVSPFITFFSELARTQYNVTKFGLELAKGRVPDIGVDLGDINPEAARSLGRKILGVQAGLVSAATVGITMFNRSFGGVDSEEEKRMRETVFPEWDRNSSLAIVRRGDDISISNTSYLIPQTDLVKVITAATRGESFSDAFGKSIQSLVETIDPLAGDFILQALFQASRNMDQDTGNVITSETGVRGFSEKSEFFVKDAFTPGFVREYQRITRDVDPQTAKETALRMAGVRVNSFNMWDGAKFTFRDVGDRLNGVGRSFASARYKAGNNQQQIESAYQEANETYKRVFQDLSRHAQNLMYLSDGNADKVLETMKESGIGTKRALLAIEGIIPDYPRVKRNTPSAIFEEMSGLSREDQLKQIRAIEDKEMQKKVYERYKKDVDQERMGIGPIDRAIMGLGIKDGERASFIYDKMSKIDNPTAYFNELKKKGIITVEVHRQLRELGYGG